MNRYSTEDKMPAEAVIGIIILCGVIAMVALAVVAVLVFHVQI